MEQNKQNKWKEIAMRDKVYLAIIAVLLIIIFVLAQKLAGAKTPEQEPEQTEISTETDVSDAEPEEAEAPEPENNLEENTHASIDKLVGKYCEYIANGDVDALEEIVDVLSDEEKEKIQNRAAFIESFENVTCYTKNGPIEDSYIVFVCYDMKLINIETSAPDIICLYVGPKGADGHEGRRIHYGTIDESMQEYVAELEKDPEVQALYDDVSTRYQEAQEQDETLAAFIQKISGQVSEETEEEASEEPEESGETEEESEEAEEGSEEEEAQEEEEEEASEEAQGEATAQNRETRVTESVNIRSEASTESDRVALAYQGDPITQIESYDNGWSKVEYKGKTGYVKTEFLE